MKKSFLPFFSLIFCAFTLHAQMPYMSAIPNGNNKKAVAMEQVGLVDITINYHRPSVNGREGKIWGELIHKGFTDLGFGSNNPAPWRAGANENTTIEFGSDVKIEGQALQKGKYALFIAYDNAESIVIFSKKTDAWGSFFYDQKDDVLRVKVKPQPLDKSVEWLRFEFTNQTENAAIIACEWEKLAIPFKVEVDYLKQQFEALSAELKNPRGFTWQSANIAANWCLQRNYQLEQGLVWSKSAMSNGGKSFTTLNTTVQLLEKLGKKEEATDLMKQAIAVGNMTDLHQYARQLLQQKKTKEALEIFNLNLQKNPNQFMPMVGLVRGLSANGQYKDALELAQKAMPLAPNDVNKKAVQEMIDKLKEGKDVN